LRSRPPETAAVAVVCSDPTYAQMARGRCATALHEHIQAGKFQGLTSHPANTPPTVATRVERGKLSDRAVGGAIDEAKDTLVSGRDLAEDWLVSPERVRQLAKEGVIPKAARDRYSRREATQGYIRWLRERPLTGLNQTLMPSGPFRCFWTQPVIPPPHQRAERLKQS
jgi:hypothetical protein